MATEILGEISQKVQESLKDGHYACSGLIKLPGGTANFVYRGTLARSLPDGTKTVVIKHTESYVASNPNFRLTDTRCDYERTILTALHSFPTLTQEGVEIQTPHLHLFDRSTNTQVYSDLPASVDLKTYVLTHSSTLTQTQCERLGQAMGTWCKAFHMWASAEEQKELRESMKGNKAMRDLKYAINYSTLLGTVDNFPDILGGSRKVFQDVAESVKKELDERDGELIHGDFWTGNILLPTGPILHPSSTPLKIFIIDWELSQLSLTEFDLGQMIGELYELKHFKDYDAGLWLIDSFLKGYGKVEEEVVWKTVIHTGCHLVCWGSRVAGWGTNEQVEGVVRVGRDWILAGRTKERGALDGSILESLFG